MLDTIAEHKRLEVEQRQQRLPLAQLQQRPEMAQARRDFIASLRSASAASGFGLIAELKRASPSKGLIREDFDVAKLAQEYQDGGAACLSVLTDENYFRGHDGYLQIARACTQLPVLRKDFIVDSYQLYESRLLGADCILLIAAILSDEQLRDYSAIAKELAMAVLFEVHDQAELERVSQLALDSERHLLGINNRDLRSFQTSLDTSIQLSAAARDTGLLLVSESGINSRADIQKLQQHNLHCYLIGESLMRWDSPAAGIQALRGS